jgi:glycosyltransferase involved in cell wall biosynthesis
MKSGVIPIVNDISGGIQELIEDNITGYNVRNNNPAEYAAIIQKISVDYKLVNKISFYCINRGSSLFIPVVNTLAFEELFKQASIQNKKKKKIKVYGSRLDKSWIPNALVSQIRKRNNKINTL